MECLLERAGDASLVDREIIFFFERRGLVKRRHKRGKRGTTTPGEMAANEQSEAMKQFKELQVRPRTTRSRRFFPNPRRSPGTSPPRPLLDEPPRSRFPIGAASPTVPADHHRIPFKNPQSKFVETTQRSKGLAQNVLQRKKDIHMAALTGAELSSLPDDIPCYKPVGRSFVREPKPTIMSALEEQVKTASEEIEKTEGQKEHMQKVLNETETNIKELLQGNEALSRELLKAGYMQ